MGSYIVRWHGQAPRAHGNLNDPACDADVMRINILPCSDSYGMKASFWFGKQCNWATMGYQVLFYTGMHHSLSYRFPLVIVCLSFPLLYYINFPLTPLT